MSEAVLEMVKKELQLTDLPGVGAATAEKLIEAGFDSLMALAVATPATVVEVAGLGEPAARKIINTARNSLDMGFETGSDLLNKRNSVVKISVGSKNFDEMIGGGVESGAITECYGAYGSGKTSIAHQLAVNVQLPKEQGGAEGIAVWIDTEGTLRPEYLKPIAEAKGMDPEEALKNFRGVRAFNSDHQMLLVEKIEDLIKKDGLPVKLIILDSLMGHFRSEFSGRGTLADRQQKLNKHMHTLLKLATQHNIAVYITNQVMSKPDTFFGDPTVAIGGHVVAHTSTVRIYLRRGKKGTRVAKLVDAPALPDGEAAFVVTNEGIKDVP
jgi:DNA repair protein RadA